jgi:hypothetical protein
LNLKHRPQRQQVATTRRSSLRLGSHDLYTLDGQWELSTDDSTWNDDLKNPLSAGGQLIVRKVQDLPAAGWDD